MKFSTFLKVIVSSHSGISSKRFCGLIGWVTCLGIIIYCTIACVQAPLIVDTVLYCCMGLLGIDSITGIWKKHEYYGNIKKLDKESVDNPKLEG